MKKILLSIFGFVVLITAGFYFLNKDFHALVQNFVFQSPCDSPIHYRVDLVDNRFNLSKNEFLSDIVEAGSSWSNVYGKPLFVYDPKGGLTINMLFDERQSLTDQINGSENTLQSEKSSIDPQLADYQNMAAGISKKNFAALNAEIDYWNSHGGAQPDEYAKLKSEQEDLKTEAATLNGLAQKLNQSTDQYNAQIGNLNQTVDTLNSALKAKPEEGLYESAGPRITIYFNNGHTELIHTLAHEMGHSLGMVHVTDPNAIMYPYTNETTLPTIDDKLELARVCQKQNIVLILRNKLSAYIFNLRTNQN